MTTRRARYLRHRFPPEIISYAVWLYHRFCLSFRDAEDLLAQRGVTVTYETIRQWCHTFGRAYARRLRQRRGKGRIATRVQHTERDDRHGPPSFVRHRSMKHR